MDNQATIRVRRTSSSWQVLIAATLAVALLAASYVAIQMRDRAQWAPILSDLSQSNTTQVTQQLGRDGVRFKLTDHDRTILVPVKQIDSERVKLAGVGLPTK